ncbi:MAG: hypothetical protein ACOYEW_07620 [Anaerolineae bacterium]
MLRLGTGPRLLSRPDLLTHDTRTPVSRRHLSVSLVCLWDLLRQAAALGIGLYRVSSHLVTVMGPEDEAGFERQLEDCADMLAWLGAQVRTMGIRLTAHPLLHIQLGSEDQRVVDMGLASARAWAGLFEALGLPAESVVVVHVGGGAETPRAAERFVANALRLPDGARRRLALENDDSLCSLEEVLWAAGEVGLPVVLDYLHWRCNHGSGRDGRAAVQAALATWPLGVRPKLHFSSPETGGGRRPPRPREHGEYLDPFGFMDFAALLPSGSECDVMLEAGARDLALLKLRRDLKALGWEEAQGVAVGLAG